jgi:hypothetical protein
VLPAAPPEPDDVGPYRALASLLGTDVAGIIVADTIWTPAGSPYALSDHVIVAAGATLTVTAGVEVRGATDRGLKVAGRLVAAGTSSASVTFTSEANTAAGQWDGILFRAGSSGALTYATVRYGGTWNGSAYGDIVVRGATITLDHVRLLDSAAAPELSHGLDVDGRSVVTVTNSEIGQHTGRGIHVQDSTLTATNVTVHHAGGHGIYVQNSALTMSNSTAQNNGDHGLYVADASSAIALTGNTYSNNAAASLYLWANQVAGGGLTTSTFSGNGQPGIEIAGGVLAASMTWPALVGSWYRLMGNVTVGSGQTLTLQPGVVVKGAVDQGLRVDGALVAVGTAAAPITFTSDTDTGAGQWDGLTFRPGSTGALTYAMVRYAGSWDGIAYSAVTVRGPATVAISQTQILDSDAGASNANGLDVSGGAQVTVCDSIIDRHDGHGVYAAGGSLTLSGTTLQNNGGDGVYIGDASTTLTILSNTIQNNGGAPFHLWPGQIIAANLTGNVFSGNGQAGIEVEAGMLNEDANWPLLAGSWYRLVGSVSVGPEATLTLAPGTIIKGLPDQGFRVDGQLLAEGAAGNPILFTSDADTGAGQWDGLTFRPGSRGRLSNVIVRYGGTWDGIAYSGVSVQGAADLVVTQSEIRNSGMSSCCAAGLYIGPGSRVQVSESSVVGHDGDGVRVFGSSAVTLTNVTVSGNGGAGLYATDGASPAVIASALRDNTGDGVRSVSGRPRVYGSAITGNTNDGIAITGSLAPEVHNSLVYANHGYQMRNDSALAVNATLNWWGQDPPASGNFYQHPGPIVYAPWLTSANPISYSLTGLDFSADPYESNDAFAQATALSEPGLVVDATIAPHGDVNLFQIHLDQPGNFSVIVDPQGGQFTPRLTIYNASQSVLTQTTGAVAAVISASVPISPGLYYIGVRDVNDTRSDPTPYTLLPLLASSRTGLVDWASRQPGNAQLALLPSDSAVDLPVGATRSLQTRVPATATLPPGGYFLGASIRSTAGQLLAENITSFYLTDQPLALLMNLDRPAYKPGQAVQISGEVRNRGATAIAGKALILAVNNTPFYTQTVSLPADGSTTFAAGVQATASFTLTGVISDTLVTRRVPVATPVVSATLTAPAVSLPGAIVAELSLANTGIVPASFDLAFLGQAQAMQLDVGATALLTRTVAITRDTVLTAALTGQITTTVTTTVRYSPPPILTLLPDTRYPTGAILMPYRVSNPGLLDLTFPVTFTLSPPPVYAQALRWRLAHSLSAADRVIVHAVPASAIVTGTLAYSLPKDDYTLSFDTPFQTGSAGFSVLNETELSLNATALALANQTAVVSATISNIGVNSFSGTLYVTTAFSSGELPVELASGASNTYTTTVDMTDLGGGVYTADLALKTPAGAVVASKAVSWTLQGPDWQVAALSAPTDLDVGRTYTLTFAVANQGNAPDQAAFGFDLGDVAHDAQSAWVNAGQTGVFTTTFYLPDDLTSGRYVASYRASSDLDVYGDRKDLSLNIHGIDVAVSARTDKAAYLAGETANVTLAITNTAAVATPDLYALVSFNGITQTQTFSLAPFAAQSATFPVSASFAGDAKVFYGIYNARTDRGIHLNTLYLYQAQSDVTLMLDKQVYAPGDAVHATALTSRSGTLTVHGPGETSKTVTLTGQAITLDLLLPDNLTQGTYYLHYVLTGCGCDNEGREWSIPFDVSAALAQITDVQLTGGGGVGDIVTATLTIVANRAITGTLSNWLEYPDGTAGATTVQAVALLPISNNRIVATSVITDAQWGSYRMGYRLETTTTAAPSAARSSNANVQEMLSGAESFDVGQAALLAVKTDSTTYPGATDPVSVLGQVFASASQAGQLNCVLDDGMVVNRDLTLTAGLQSVTVALPSGITPGHRTLTVTLLAGNARSRLSSTIAFDYGTTLPDLTVRAPWLVITDTVASQVIVVGVANEGKSASLATTAAIYDGDPRAGGSLIGIGQVVQLPPGASAIVAVPWDATGAVGDHALYAVVDPAGQVTEFNEANNQARGDVTVRSEAATTSIVMAVGWNLIALPRVPSDPSPAAVFASITGKYDLAYTFDACDTADPWKRFDPAAPPQANDLTTMTDRRGYWVRMTQPTVLTLAGSQSLSTTISLCVGWNLIGYPSTSAVSLPSVLTSIAGKYDLIYTYVAGGPDPWKRFDPFAPSQVNDLTAMVPARGYWIRMMVPAVLNVP